MLTVRSSAPTRVDLAGGTIDLWPIHQLLDAPATVNVAVTLPASVELEVQADQRFTFVSDDQGRQWQGDFADAVRQDVLPLLGLFVQAQWHKDLPGLRIRTAAKSPAGAGLGGSSTLSIALLGALRAARAHFESTPELSHHQLVAIAQDVEARIILAPTGVQDYWGAVRGGVNILTYPAGGVDVDTRLPSTLSGLADGLILCFSGQSRASAINNWEIFKRVFDGDKVVLERLNAIADCSRQCAIAVRQGSVADLLKHSRAEWDVRRQLWPNIVTDKTEQLHAAAVSAGALYTRVCGAGGGGVMAILSPPAKKPAVISALQKAGGHVLDASIAERGLTVDVSN